MKTIRYLAERHPNQVGEILRGEFFVGYKPPWESNPWEFKEATTNPLPSKVVLRDSEEGDGIRDYTIFRAHMNLEGEDIVCEWYWNEDYFLSFEFDDGTCLSNSDAAKDNNWMFESEDYVPKS